MLAPNKKSDCRKRLDIAGACVALGIFAGAITVVGLPGVGAATLIVTFAVIHFLEKNWAVKALDGCLTITAFGFGLVALTLTMIRQAQSNSQALTSNP